MTERRGRGEATSFGQAAAYNRIMERVDEGNQRLTDRLEGLFDQLNDRIARIDRDLATKEQADGMVQIELRELSRGLGELREQMVLVDGRRTAAAALGAARGAGEAAGEVAAAIAKTKTGRASWWAKVAAVMAGLILTMQALDNIPDAVRAWDKLWAVLGNRAGAAETREDKHDGQ